MDKVSIGEKKRNLPTVCDTSQDGEDAEAVEAHLSELKKEMKRKNYDEEKVARLLSLTFDVRRKEMLSQPANSRISSANQIYKCLTKPVFVSSL